MGERCSVTRGRHRCDSEVGHVGEHKTRDRPIAWLGPYTTRIEALAYLRGRLEASRSMRLDTLGVELGMRRESGEHDEKYRERMWKAASR